MTIVQSSTSSRTSHRHNGYRGDHKHWRHHERHGCFWTHALLGLYADPENKIYESGIGTNTEVPDPYHILPCTVPVRHLYVGKIYKGKINSNTEKQGVLLSFTFLLYKLL
jgi:hypothetical protein